MRSITRQQGMTGIGWMLVMALIGFFVLLGLRMVPVYMEYYKVVSTLEGFEEEPGFSSPGEIRKLAERRFDISYVSVITPKDLTIKPKGDKYTVQAKYTAREHLFFNVSVLMEFDKTVTVDRK